MDLLLDILFEVYVELMGLIVPEEKTTTKKFRALVALIAFTVLIGVVALIIWGCVLITEKNNLLGIIPIAIGGVISIAQIVAGIIISIKKNRQFK